MHDKIMRTVREPERRTGGRIAPRGCTSRSYTRLTSAGFENVFGAFVRKRTLRRADSVVDGGVRGCMFGRPHDVAHGQQLR
jgi:hypothetical protein